MVSLSNCVITGALLGGFGLTWLLGTQAERRGSPFKASLRPDQAAKYEEISAMRRRLANQGFLLGAILALGYLIYNRMTSESFAKGGGLVPLLCTAIAISLTTTYFYYMLSPKPDYMVRYLDAGSPQIDAYLDTNRAYQLRWTGGLLLGGAAAHFLGQALRTAKKQ